MTFNGSDGHGGSGTASTTITVNNVNRPPTAMANGPYSGVVLVNVNFSSAGSSDPDGSGLTYLWDFGDLSTSTSANPSHPYATAGLKNVTLTVFDPSLLSGMDATTATISDVFAATVFTTGGNTKTSLVAGKPFTCFQVQPLGGSFDIGSVDLSSIKLYYGTAFISASGKTVPDGDKNGDGIQEIAACFSKADLRILFAGLPAGTNFPVVRVEGNLTGGGRFSGENTHTVKTNGTFLAARIYPNPLNPKATVTFRTMKPGLVKVTMYDLQGRLVKQVADEQFVPAGYHDFSIDGTNANGNHIASGVYFVKVWTEHDGTEVQHITVLK